MPIQLRVPLVAQSTNSECWYASACMVAYFFAPGPRLGLPERWKENVGIDPTLGDFAALAKVEHLASVAAAHRKWNEEDLFRILRDFGPIWCAGYWDGLPHVVVLTGVENGTVFINDPGGPRKREETIAWFNEKLAKRYPDCMLRRCG